MVIILVTANVVAYHPRVRKLILALRSSAEKTVARPLSWSASARCSPVGSPGGSGSFSARSWSVRWASRGPETQCPSTIRCWPSPDTWGWVLNWGWGLSSSAGLLQATEGNALMQLGFVDRIIPATEWVFHSYPLTLTALSLVYGSIMLYPPLPAERELQRHRALRGSPGRRCGRSG